MAIYVQTNNVLWDCMVIDCFELQYDVFPKKINLDNSLYVVCSPTN